MFSKLLWAAFAAFTLSACGDPAAIQDFQAKPPRVQKAKKQKAAEPPKAPSTLLQNHPANVVPKGHKDSSGVVVLAEHSNELYVLLGKERQGHGASEKWNFMRGAVDTGQTYLASAMRELDEETAGFCNTSLEELATAPYSTFKKGSPWNNIAYTFFVQKTYVDENLMRQRSEDLKSSGADHHFWEMTDYQWVKLGVLMKALEQNNRFLSAVVSPMRSTQSMEIYDYSFGLLLKALPEFKAIAARGRV